MKAPALKSEARRAVDHRGSPIQIIAAAGSGKTEVVSQRVASLLSDKVAPSSIVAFTFTERASIELKSRIAHRVEEFLGPQALDQLGSLYVGTIHAYCFRLLQRHVPRYETFDVLDDNQLTAFLCREANRLDMRVLDDKNRLFGSIATFLKNVDIVENELLDLNKVPQPFRTVFDSYLDTLERYRLLTYGQQIVRTVAELEKGTLAAKIHGELRHLIVDEYQDVNPAQERLIELLTGPQVELCVVGDDDQAIYQWRGSDVNNIVTFAQRYKNVETFKITKNRRSRPQIIDVANRFATSIEGRLKKTMGTDRPSVGSEPEIAVWAAGLEAEEAGWITQLILDLNDQGVPFRDMAVLVRSSAAYPRLVEHFASFDIPVQPGGRTGLFDQREAMVLGRTIAWLVDIEWRSGWDTGKRITEKELLDEYQHVFTLSDAHRNRLRRLLREWRDAVPKQRRRADLVGELYELLDVLEVKSWDVSDRLQLNRLGTFARFSSLLADYESVRRRARPDIAVPGEQVGGEDRGTWYYKNLAIHIINYAQGAYEDFDGEPDFDLDAVDLTTVHRAKGLEWPVVFIPSMTRNRFPTKRTGTLQHWLIPREDFAASRYEGSDADERRLFYVALTRARDWVSVSRHDRVNKQVAPPSPYWEELRKLEVDPQKIRLPTIESREIGVGDPIDITYSELADYLDCAFAYRLRNLVGFQPRLATELGYGRAVHHVLRAVAAHTQELGAVPTKDEIEEIFDQSFFLPTANKPAHRELKEAARRLVTDYIANHSADLHRVWETERPFELHLDGVIISGRADVILDTEGGVPKALAILDYKTSTSGELSEHALQLQVYADAGRREGLDVVAAFVHDLKKGARESVDVAAAAVSNAEATVTTAANRLKSRDYAPSPGKRCLSCEVRLICAAAKY